METLSIVWLCVLIINLGCAAINLVSFASGSGAAGIVFAWNVLMITVAAAFLYYYNV